MICQREAERAPAAREALFLSRRDMRGRREGGRDRDGLENLLPPLVREQRVRREAPALALGLRRRIRSTVTARTTSTTPEAVSTTQSGATWT